MYEDNNSKNMSIDFNDIEEETNNTQSKVNIRTSEIANDNVINEDGSFIITFDQNQFSNFLEFLFSINSLTGMNDKKFNESIYISVYSLVKEYYNNIKFVFRKNKSLELDFEDRFRMKNILGLNENQTSFKFRYSKDIFEKINSFSKISSKIALIVSSNIMKFSFSNESSQFSFNSILLKDDDSLYDNEINDYFNKDKNCVIIQDNLFNKFLCLRSLNSKLNEDDVVEFIIVKNKSKDLFLICCINIAQYSEKIIFEIKNKISIHDGSFHSKVSAKLFVSMLSKKMRILEISLNGSYLKISDESKHINKLIYVMSNN